MNPADKKPAPFHFVQTTVLLLAAFLILCGIKDGGMQRRLGYLLSPSLKTVKFVAKTALFFIIGYAASFSALRLLRVSPAGGKRPRTVLLALSLLALKAWADGRFPIEDAEIVVFTLANVRGGELTRPFSPNR